jgi:O-methyltransferase
MKGSYKMNLFYKVLPRSFRYPILQFLNKILLRYRVALSPSLVGYTKSLGDLSRYSEDYIRIAMWFLIASEIKEREIQGNIAEAGVYRGGTGALLNRLFADRTLYLFDTFEGFDIKDIKVEREKSYSQGKAEFADTCVEIVMNKMPFPEKCIIKKGWFPESAKDVSDHFVFVSIDFDLYQPTYEALNFFYPMMVHGGYIFVHDYNHQKFPGAKKAVDRFAHEIGISLIPIPDCAGSVLLIKN